MSKPATMRLADYRRPAFSAEEVELFFDIHDSHTMASSKVTYKRTAEGQKATELVLDAENPNPESSRDYLHSVMMNGVKLAEGAGYTYDKANNQLRITLDPSESEVTLEIDTYLEPQNNSALSGLYKSDSTVVTQCESQGFRRITPFLDRPDVMAEYTVTIEADPKTFPVMMANGNKLKDKTLQNGRRQVVYNDPFPKPSYLFATANGDLDVIEDIFTTKSGRPVNVRVYTERGDSAKAHHALEALKLSMKWDEDVFDCEYDLDDFNIVAVSKFSFGAMENKGLNVFRDSLILATPEIATDENYQRITDVVGHEYFHNWSGNRVTVANWFNISLKEGLTVIREQMFTAFTTSEASQRIGAVKLLRAGQFPQDDSPLSHPVMPQEVQSPENCYTLTTYEKGAEVLRMMKELMGEQNFIDGVKHYFKTYDGQAVTIKEFVKSMEHVSGLDLSGQFSLWYTQSGRPRVTAQGQYDAAAQTYTLTLSQTVPPTRDQAIKKPMMIPVRIGLVDQAGQDMHQEVLVLSKSKQSFVFNNIKQEPAFHSLLRGFSAPIDLDPGLSKAQLLAQMKADPDGFNRWDAGQRLALNEMERLYESCAKNGTLPALDPAYVKALQEVMADHATDPALRAKALTLPSIKEFEARLGAGCQPAVIAKVMDHMTQTIGRESRKPLEVMFAHSHDGAAYAQSYSDVGKRALKNVAVRYLSADGAPADLARLQILYDRADNMTDQMAAMGAIRNHFSPQREAVFGDFYNRFSSDVLTIQKWFALQAGSDSDKVFDKLNEISASPAFNWENPGHTGALFGGLAGNYAQFHRADGKGYEFIADAVIKLDKINPMVASKIIEPLCSWRGYDQNSSKNMIAQLERVAASAKLSVNVRDKLYRSLPDASERKGLGLSGPSL